MSARRLFKPTRRLRPSGPIPGNEANGFVFVSGQIPIDRRPDISPQAPREQMKQVMENGKAILAAAGCGMDRVVKATIYFRNIGDFATVNEVYGSYSRLNARRATVEVSTAAQEAEVEIDLIAVKDEGSRGCVPLYRSYRILSAIQLTVICLHLLFVFMAVDGGLCSIQPPQSGQ